MIKITGIDPGSKKSAFVKVDFDPKYNEIEILDKNIFENKDIEKYNLLADIIIMEDLSNYGAGFGSHLLNTAKWIGYFHRIFENKGAKVFLMYRKDAVYELCGTRKAGDKEIRKALIKRFGEPGTKKQPGILYGFNSHFYAALALVIAFAENYDLLKKIGEV